MQSKLSEIGERVEWLWKKMWSGSQTKMAADIGVSQSVISHVVTGRQEPGRKFLAAVASNPLINSTWLMTGQGDPFISNVSEPGRRALYVTRTLFEGSPEDHAECLGGMLEVPVRFYRASRYWYEVSVDCPLANFSALKIAVGDIVLFEPDPKGWPETVVGHPCIVRGASGELNCEYILDQKKKKFTTTSSETKPRESSEGSKQYRSIIFADEETAPTRSSARNHLTAIGLFRMGGFGGP